MEAWMQVNQIALIRLIRSLRNLAKEIMQGPNVGL